MKLRLKRTSFTDDGIFSLLLDEAGNIVCYTLEHAYQDKPGAPWLPKIPDGEYTCKRRLSPHFGYDLFIILNVPGHDFIEIHIGNTQADSKGCVLLGTAIYNTSLTDSRKAFDKFIELTAGLETFQLVVG